MTSLLFYVCDLDHVGDLIDHPANGRRIVVDHRLLMPLDAKGFQRPPVFLQATDPTTDLLDGDLLSFGALLVSHDAPPRTPRAHPVRTRPVRP